MLQRMGLFLEDEQKVVLCVSVICLPGSAFPGLNVVPSLCVCVCVAVCLSLITLWHITVFICVWVLCYVCHWYSAFIQTDYREQDDQIHNQEQGIFSSVIYKKHSLFRYLPSFLSFSYISSFHHILIPFLEDDNVIDCRQSYHFKKASGCLLLLFLPFLQSHHWFSTGTLTEWTKACNFRQRRTLGRLNFVTSETTFLLFHPLFHQCFHYHQPHKNKH